jgi:hypothetical protein
MAASTGKLASKAASAQKRAARQAEAAAKVLHSLASSLNSLHDSNRAIRKPAVTPRNWWKVQAGRFRDDPTFAEFVSQVRAARKREG